MSPGPAHRYALFGGCNVPARLPQYEASARAVMERLDVSLVDIKEFNCCGYPLRNYNEKAFLMAAARDLALAEKHGLDIAALCMCCFGTLKKAQRLLNNGSPYNDEIKAYLGSEKLAYGGNVRMHHVLSILYHEIGMDTVAQNIRRPYRGLKIAAHHGCHALRPADITGFDDPDRPVVFDLLVEATGAVSVHWDLKLQCCGAPVLGTNDSLSMGITGRKVADAEQSGADFICSACPWCQLQFNAVQKNAAVQGGGGNTVLSLLYTQLLGLAMGIESEHLMIDNDDFDAGRIMDYL